MNQREAKRLACRIASDLIFRYIDVDGDDKLTEADTARLDEALRDLSHEMLRRSGAPGVSGQEDPHG